MKSHQVFYPDANTFVNDTIARAAEADKEKLQNLREALIEGEESDTAKDFNVDNFLTAMHKNYSK